MPGETASIRLRNAEGGMFVTPNPAHVHRPGPQGPSCLKTVGREEIVDGRLLVPGDLRVVPSLSNRRCSQGTRYGGSCTSGTPGAGCVRSPFNRSTTSYL